MRGSTAARTIALLLLLAIPALFVMKLAGVQFPFLNTSDKPALYTLVAVWNASFAYVLLRVV